MAEPPETTPDALPPLNILALDDDADFRQYITALLEDKGHRVRAVASPKQFYDACEQALPDVALLDIKMGRHSGEEVLDEIRQRWSKLCVIVVTGFPSLDSMRQTFKQNVFDYLAKPFSTAELQHVLAQAVEAFGLGARPLDKLRGELGRQIRINRTERGWTLRELSEHSGISVSQLSSIERGAHLPSVESLVAVAEALDAKPSAWFQAAGF